MSKREEDAPHVFIKYLLSVMWRVLWINLWMSRQTSLPLCFKLPSGSSSLLVRPKTSGKRSCIVVKNLHPGFSYFTTS